MSSYPTRIARQRWRAAARVAALAICMLAFASFARGQTSFQYDQDFNLTYEFDDNVREDLVNPVEAQVAKVAYRGDLLWGEAGRHMLSLNYQGGMKRHFGQVQDTFDVTNQFINDATLGYRRRVAENIALGAAIGLKSRKWREGFFFINEDGFLRYNGSASAQFRLQPTATGSGATIEVGGRWSAVEFDNLDQSFGNDGIGAYTSLTKNYGDDISVTWSYSFDRVQFPGRGVLNPEDDDPANILRGITRPRQEDRIHELGTEVFWFGDVSVRAEYRYRYSDSNSFGFTYSSHNFGVQLLRRFPWGVRAQLYGVLELRDFSEPVPNFTGGSLDTGDAENNVLLLQVTKDVSPDYSIDVQYGRYRNESLTLNDFYTKNIYSMGVSYRP